MNKKDLEDYLSNHNFDWFELGSDFQKDSQFITAIYSDEEKPIFEHSPYHGLSYLQFQSYLYALNCRFGSVILVLRNGTPFLFTPCISHFPDFEDFALTLAKDLNLEAVEIQNVSEQWLKSFEKQTSQQFRQGCLIKPRSKEEVIYDVELLNKLPGKDFAKMRNTRNKLLYGGLLKFQPITKDNFPDVMWVLDTWQKSQGHKYAKDKYEKEKFVLGKFLEFSSFVKNFLFEIGYYESKPLSFLAMYKIPYKEGWGTLYFAKGINRVEDGGIHGVSDAAYCRCFLKAKEMGMKHLNDGELGSEEGTRTHKLGFKPIMFLKSFDILYNRKHE